LTNDITVAEAGDAREMNAILKDSRIDLVVLDIMLPGEDGIVSVEERMAAYSDSGDDATTTAALDVPSSALLAYSASQSASSDDLWSTILEAMDLAA
jgi:CheY-like chemotaxis protein